MRIEDYAMIGDLQTAALVGRNGSVDWLCLPRFDSPSCFTALLGDETHGRWLIAPVGEVRGVSRRYREGTLILETDFETAEGAARVIDFMPLRDGGAPQLMRIVRGLRGRVPMRMQLIIRFQYGSVVPWVERVPGGIVAQAGPDALHLITPVELRGEDLTTVAEFTVGEGSGERFVLSWFPSYERAAPTEDAHAALARTEAWWREWSGRCTHRGEYRDEVLTSLIVLKGLTDQVTGGGGRRAHHVAPGGPRRRAQLGLPLHLAARLGPDPQRPARRRLHRGGAGLHRVRVPGDGRAPRGAADHVRHRRGAAAGGVRDRLAAGLRGLQAGPGRQRGRGPVPARRVRRGRRRGVGGGHGPGPGEGPAPGASLAPAAKAHGPPRDRLARARRRDVGGAGAAAPLHPVQAHGLGRVRPRDQVERALRAGGAARALEGGPCRDPRRDPREGLRPAAQHVHAELRLPGPGRRRC